MKNLFILIDQEISLSKSKVKYLKSSSIQEFANKFDIFTKETIRLNKVLTDSINSHIRSNDLTESQIEEIKNYASDRINDFIKSAGF